ncbi:hypothetical protein F4778DRAFT_673038 [Xylariomycetidae sp. FL2044]|nr:hypothetical protein F4778DRAFT_673038 [Xylariomycetidae sp. FL2044]
MPTDATMQGTEKNARESIISSGTVDILPSSLRRTTCDVCRERKVRCDRTKPECVRCRRFGRVCTYPSMNADAERIHKTLHNLSKRLEDAESKLQSHQLSPYSAPEGQAFDAMVWSDQGDTNEFSDLHWDQAMGQLILPGGLSFNGIPGQIESVSTSATASTSHASSLPQEFGHEALSVCTTGQPHSPAGSALQACTMNDENSASLFETYFNVVHPHLPLLNRQDVFQNISKQASEKHQNLALKYAICLAGAQAGGATDQIKAQYHVAARHHLEQAELGSDGSSFWTVEAAQALVLVARFEFQNFATPRATITASRLSALMSTLNHHDKAGLDATQGSEGEKQHPLRIISLISLSIECLGAYVGESTRSKTSPSSQDIALGRLKIDLLKARHIPEDETFAVLCTALRIALDARHHEQVTAAVVAGVDIPSFNFCRDHECLETRIRNLVANRLTPSSSSGLSSGPHHEIRILALLTALGTRIQLFKTASYHGRRSKFLSTISHECREESMASAIDLSDLLRIADVAHPDKIAIYREAGLYLMPPLRLAAEALLPILQARDQQATKAASYRKNEIRQSLKTIVQVMDACKNGAGSYDDLVVELWSCLEDSEEQPMPLRTTFSASSLSARKTWEPTPYAPTPASLSPQSRSGK